MTPDEYREAPETVGLTRSIGLEGKATMNVKTANAIMSLHRKQMADALTNKGREDMLGFHYAAFRHRQLVRKYWPDAGAYADLQNPEQTARDVATRVSW